MGSVGAVPVFFKVDVSGAGVVVVVVLVSSVVAVPLVLGDSVVFEGRVGGEADFAARRH